MAEQTCRPGEAWDNVARGCRAVKQKVVTASTPRSPDWAEVIIYVSIAVLFSWTLLKAIGVIPSPVWVDMIPWFSVTFGVGAFYQKFAQLLTDVSKLVDKVSDIDKRVIYLEFISRKL